MMSEEETKSLYSVQRIIVSALIIVVCYLFAAVLALYLVVFPEGTTRTDVIGLWVMTGVIGMVSTGAVVLINGRKLYSPWMLAGLIPMAVAAPWILG